MSTSKRTSRKAGRVARLLGQIEMVAERYGLHEDETDLARLQQLAASAREAGASLREIRQATERAAERGVALRAPAEPVRKPEPPPEPAVKRRMISSAFYPEQPCGLSYRDFKVGHTYKDAYDTLAYGTREEGTYRTIGRSTVLRQLARMKRATYEQYKADCEAQEQFEQEQAHGGREGEYAMEDSGEFDVSFDPTAFAPADEEIAFNGRRRRVRRNALMVTEPFHVGEEVYHGTVGDDDGRQPGFDRRAGHLWVSDTTDGADFYSHSWPGVPWRLTFEVIASPRLIFLRDFSDLDALALDVFGYPRGEWTVDPRALAADVCKAGYDGWHVKHGEGGGSDTLLCEPARFLRLAKTERLDEPEVTARNPRCPSCGGASHPATGSVLPSGEVVCGPCVRRFWAWAAKHGENRYRVGPKGKGATYIPFPTGVEKPK